MAITYNETVTYQDLINDVIDKIKNLCINVDKNPSLPKELNPVGTPDDDDKERIISQFTRKTENDCWAKFTIESKNNSLLANTLNKKVLSGANDKDPAPDTVKGQLNSFLKTKGITSKTDEVITFKGLMNFYVNAASFIASRIVLVGNSLYAPDGTEGIKFTESESMKAKWSVALYNNGNVTYSNSSDYWNKENNFAYGKLTYTSENIKTDIVNIIRSIANPTGVEYVKATITFGCCSSSSSSSCCSCSSSSSLFIAYMEI